MNTVLENLTASQMRVTVTNAGGYIGTGCTLGRFVHHNRVDIVPALGRDAVAKLARDISVLGVATVTLGRRSVFEIRAA